MRESMSSDAARRPWLSRLYDSLSVKATGPVLVYFAVVVFVLFLLVFGSRQKAIEETCLWTAERSPGAFRPNDFSPSCPGGSLTFDLNRDYGPTQAQKILMAQGEKGRLIYAYSQLSLDFAFPLVYGAFGLLLLTYLSRPPRAVKTAVHRWRQAGRLLLLLPFAFVAADLAENLITAQMALRFNGDPPKAALAASLFTKLKLVLIEASLVAALALLIFRAGLSVLTRRWRLIALLRRLRSVAKRHRSLSAVLLRWLRLAVIRGVGRHNEREIPDERKPFLVSKGIRYLFLIRVPLLGAAFLVALGWLGTSSRPEIENAMLLETWSQLALVTFLALLAGAATGFTGLLAWECAHLRFRVAPWPLPRPLRRPGIFRAIWFAPLGSPLIASTVFRSVTPPNGVLGTSDLAAGLIVGVAATASVACVVEVLRRIVLGKPIGRLATDRWIPKRLGFVMHTTIDCITRVLGKGYFDPNKRRPFPGHAMAMVGLIVFLVIYGLGHFLLDPSAPNWPPSWISTAAFLLLLLVIVCVGLAGLAFFLDAFRFPLLLGFALWIILVSFASEKHHSFEVAVVPRDQMGKATPWQAVQNRLGIDEEMPARSESDPNGKVLTVVTLAGGGIQAAAWAVEALTGLQKALGPEFTRSIVLLSSVSGGSVGAFFFLEGIDRKSGVLQDRMIMPLRRAAAESSLEEAAWGLAYPDLIRAVNPIGNSSTRSRAWAVERAWLRAAGGMTSGPPPSNASRDKPTKLSHLAEDAAKGALPGVIFNSTFVEDAQQAWFSNLDLSSLDDPEAPEPRLHDPTQRRHFSRARNRSGQEVSTTECDLDVDAVTAARLSATFPYVTPIARAEDRTSGLRLPGYHFADGGYFDNFGTVAALEFVLALFGRSGGNAQKDETESRTSQLRGSIERVLFVEVRPFPPSDGKSRDSDGGLIYAAWAPIKTILGVRTSTQARRSQIEIGMLTQSLQRHHVELEHLVLQPRRLSDNRYPPVSWFLSPKDKRQICLDWQDQEEKVKKVRTWFPHADWDWPTVEECDHRLNWTKRQKRER